MENQGLSLGDKMRKGAVWWSVGHVCGRVFSIIAGIVLARLLFPEDYGLKAMAATFSGLVALLGSVGVGKMLIQQHDDFDGYANAGFRINILLGIGLFFLQIACAPFVGEFFEENVVSNIVRVSAIGYLIWPLGSIHTILLTKSLEIKKKVIAQTISSFLVSFLSIGFALSGFGVWSFVIPSLLVAPIEVLMYWYIVPWRPTKKSTAGYWKPIVSFGGNIMGVNILSYIGKRMDVLLVGKFLGVDLVGLYSFAIAVSVEFLTMVIRRSGNNIVYPALAEMKKNSNVFNKGFLRLTTLNSLILSPIIILLAGVMPEIIVGIYGSKWINAAIPAVLLCVGQVFNPLTGLCGQASDVVGRPDLRMKWTLITLPFYILTIVYFMSFGLIGLAGARSGFIICSNLAWIIIALNMLNISKKEVLAAFSPGFLSACFMVLCVVLIKNIITQYFDLPVIIELSILCVMGLGIYLAALRIFSPTQFQILVFQFQKFLPRSIRFLDFTWIGVTRKG